MGEVREGDLEALGMNVLQRPPGMPLNTFQPSRDISTCHSTGAGYTSLYKVYEMPELS